MYSTSILKDFYRRIRSNEYLYYFDQYKTWKEAEDAARKYGDAYEDVSILSQVASATQKVRMGEALYEQDGVCYYSENNIYEVLNSLLYILAHEDRLTLCDFGGALGSLFFRYRKYLPLNKVDWFIIEQSHYVDYGKNNIPELSFFYSLDECIRDNKKPNAIMFSGVLQYLASPYELINTVNNTNIDYIIIDETSFFFSDSQKETIVLQHVPAYIYNAVYPVHLFNQTSFCSYIEQMGYAKVFEWVYPQGAIPIRTKLGFKPTIDLGFLYKRIIT